MIREATLDDMEFLVERATTFNDRYYYVPINETKLRSVLESLITGESGIVLVNDAGFIAGFITEDPCRDWTVLAEMGWFAEGGGGMKLLDFFTWWGKSMDVDEIRMTTLSTSHPVVTDKLNACGYRTVETSHGLVVRR